MHLSWFLLTAAVTLLASCDAAPRAAGFDQTKLSKSVSSSTDAVEKGTRFLRGADTGNDGSDESDEERGVADFLQKPQLFKWWLDDRTVNQAYKATVRDHDLRVTGRRFPEPYIGSFEHRKFLNYQILLKKESMMDDQLAALKALKLELKNEKVPKAKLQQEVKNLLATQTKKRKEYSARLKKEREQLMKEEP